MRSAVLQFLLAGALVVAWIWMLGRPLLALLARRSRRDSVGHFRYQQAALSRSAGVDPSGGSFSFAPLRPLLVWRDQPIEQRRLQLMLGSALATFASALLAIALRGSYIQLFLVMAIGFTAHLMVAAWIGSRQLRRRDAVLLRQSIDTATARSAGRSAPVSVRSDDAVDGDPYGIDDLLTGGGIDGGLFDEGFFEPIPELQPDEATAPAAPATPAASDDRQEPTFTSPPTVRSRPTLRNKGRPIYVEPEPDDGDGSVRAVND